MSHTLIFNMSRPTRTLYSILREIEESSSGSSDEKSDNNSEVENVHEDRPSTSRAQCHSSSRESEEDGRIDENVESENDNDEDF